MDTTHTKTFVVLHPWAETTPWECLVRATECISADHKHSPMVGDPCAVDDCDETLLAGEVTYAVIELDRSARLHADYGEPWVCWRHVRPDDGPITVED